ncbi:uncharacterized protein CcaverHIS019_0703870 [Cutaneotrichosporon cavernicola]|uniref:U3 small nucleolar RNA-associated protein 13 C-terminal domain-containing protein n=1 Tax=Cutaneotrichosporon cavernicola TaxID=279322 RepID=A0AA48L9S2_9TREE|nr:uncharacterized protein CcaverHIS019_0703870 [Cutaneotrichosporon cavernicola]BEI94806.1 hypothetical protein CcaverHIS019_0703870 [Cutaneotrichosporon cavernicola]BEJ02581.1 hypothetical protein CcaverHIS631_0703760 [Cutaneotrichosporon cavernicola]BEJ10337.1 hypothetical protein CcaverHIS641_0703720 [Cutaneotrichosporon cavernicola]
MNGSKRELKTSFRASPNSIRPLYTGGPVALTRDGQWLITTMGEEVLVTEVSSGRGVARVKGDTTDITALALSYHTSPPTLITAHASLSVRYYPLPASLPEGTAKPPFLQYTKAFPRAAGAPILLVAVSPDSTLLATGSSDGIVKVWDMAGGYVTHLFRGHGGPVSALHFSFPTNEGRQRMELWTGSTDARVRVFDLRDASARVVVGGQEGKTKAKAVLESHVSVVRGIAVSEDGKYAVSGGRDKVVLVWDSKGKVIQTLLANEQVEACGLLPLGTAVEGEHADRLLCYTAGESGRVRIWDVLKGTEVAEMDGVAGVDEVDEDDEQQGVLQVMYDASSAALVSVHADQNILFHSLHSLECARQIVGFNDDIVDVAWLSPSGEEASHVALATNSNLVRVYDVGSLNARLLPGHRDMVLALARSADGKLLVTGSKDRTARLWAPRGNGWACVAIAEGHAEAVGAVAVANKGGFMFTASQDRTIKMWDLSSLSLDEDVHEPVKLRSLATLHIADKDINALDIAPNDRFLVSGSQDKLVKVFEIEHSSSSGSVKHIGTCKGHRRGVWSVRFSRTDRIVASGAADRTIKLWSLDDFSCLKTFEGHTNSVLRVDFMTVGMQLVSAGGDGLVKLWNIRDESCVATLDGHEDKVWALAISPDESTILSAGADSVATFWDDSSAAEQAEANEALIAKVQAEQDFTNYVAVGDYRRAIKLALAMGHPGRLLKLFRTVLTAAKPFAYSPEEEEEIDEIERGRVAEIDAVIAGLSALDLVRLLKCVRDWNANAKTSGVAQAVLNAVVRLKSPDEIMGAFDRVNSKKEKEEEEEDQEEDDEEEKAKEAKEKARKVVAPTISMRELLDGLLPYSERHMTRVDRLVQESYMLDYTISEMDGGMFGAEVMEVDV